MRDDDDAQLSCHGHLTQQGEHLSGLSGGEDGGGFIQDEDAALQVELLEDLGLLLFPGGKLGGALVERHLEWGLCGHELLQTGSFLFPVHGGRHVWPGEHQILCDGHAGHQGEVLVHHADAIFPRIRRVLDLSDMTAHHDLTRGGRVKAHDALHQGALARAVLTQQGVNGARWHGEGDFIGGGEVAKLLGDTIKLKRSRGLGELLQVFRWDESHDRSGKNYSPVARAPGAPASDFFVEQVMTMTISVRT